MLPYGLTIQQFLHQTYCTICWWYRNIPHNFLPKFKLRVCHTDIVLTISCCFCTSVHILIDMEGSKYMSKEYRWKDNISSSNSTCRNFYFLLSTPSVVKGANVKRVGPVLTCFPENNILIKRKNILEKLPAIFFNLFVHSCNMSYALVPTKDIPKYHCEFAIPIEINLYHNIFRSLIFRKKLKKLLPLPANNFWGKCGGWKHDMFLISVFNNEFIWFHINFNPFWLSSWSWAQFGNKLSGWWSVY